LIPDDIGKVFVYTIFKPITGQ